MRALSEVTAAFISLLVTVVLMGVFLAFNSSYLLPSVNAVQVPPVHLISVLWTYQNTVYVENYGTNPVTIAYAIVGTSTTPSPVNVYTIQGRPVPDNTLLPGQVYKLVVPQANGQNIPVTFFTTDGTLFEVIL
mgnify:CR=1 FL=1